MTGANAKIKRIYQGTNLVRPATVQTFDFQNDGTLSWYGLYLNGATPSLTSGQGWTIALAGKKAFQSIIMPPNSVYNSETLKKVKLYIYKGIIYSYDSVCHSVGAGISSNDSWNPYVCWIQHRLSSTPGVMVYDGSEHWTTTTDATGEITLEYECKDNGAFTLSINGGTAINLGSYGNGFRTAWTNKTLGLSIGRWETTDGNIYIRKVEITTI